MLLRQIINVVQYVLCMFLQVFFIKVKTCFKNIFYLQINVLTSMHLATVGLHTLQTTDRHADSLTQRGHRHKPRDIGYAVGQ